MKSFLKENWLLLVLCAASLFLFAAGGQDSRMSCDVSLTSTASAQPAPTPSTLEPFTAPSWSPVPAGAKNMSQMVWIKLDTDPAVAAAESRQLPPGRRVLFGWDFRTIWWGNIRDNTIGDRQQRTKYLSPWLEVGTRRMAIHLDQWFARFKAAGGQMDAWILDMELNLSMWAIDQAHIDAIAADPRFPEIQKLLGFEDVSGVGSYADPAKSIAWNAAMHHVINGYKRRAFYDPARKHFPRAIVSDYEDTVLSPAEAKIAPDYNAVPQHSLPPLFGDTQTTSLYGGVSWIRVRTPDGTKPNWAHPMATLVWEINRVRALRRSDPGLPHLHWFAFKGWKDGHLPVYPIADTPYYEEMVYHALLSGGSTNLLYWNPVNLNVPEADMMALDGALGDIKAASGDARALAPLTDAPIPYDSNVLVSGARCDDGRRLWRVTFGAGADEVTIALPGEDRPRTVKRDGDSPGVWIVQTLADRVRELEADRRELESQVRSLKGWRDRIREAANQE